MDSHQDSTVIDDIPMQQQPLDVSVTSVGSSRESKLLSLAQSNDIEEFKKACHEIDITTVRNSKRFTVLHFACYNNNYELVQFILNYVRNKDDGQFVQYQNVDGFAAIHFASYRGNLLIMELLIRNRANILQVTNEGMNIMHIGAQGDQPISIVFAREQGLSINQLDNRQSTPLHWASYYGNELAVNYLLSMIAEDYPYDPLNKQDTNKSAPIHLAVHSGNTKLVKKLIMSGADKFLKDKDGKDAIQIALDSDYKNIYNLITKKRNIFVAYYNIRQAIKRMRKSYFELLRFFGMMSIVILIYYMYIEIHLYDYIIGALNLILFLMVSFQNPGYQIKRDESLLQLLRNHSSLDVCPQCNVVRLQRARHCEVCQKCVLVYDHHCPWINNCVGSGNHVEFMIFIILLNLTLAYILIKFLYHVIKPDLKQTQFFESLYMEIICFIVLFGIVFLFFLGVLLLIITQITNIFYGQTTYERFALKNNSSTLRVNNPSVKTSLVSDMENEAPIDRYQRAQFANFKKFFKNNQLFRKKEREIKVYINSASFKN